MSISRKKVDTSQQDIKKKMTFLGVLSGLIALILVYQYFAASALPPIKEPPNTDAKYDKRIPASKLNGNAAASQDPKIQEASVNVIPAMLDLSLLESRNSGSSDGVRNPFEYPPPPPPLPPIPPKPATIRISTLSPTSVYAKTKSFEVVIRGTNLTDDMMIYLSGTPSFSKTVFVSDSEVRATVPENYFANPGQLNFQLKKRGQEADQFSNNLSINVLTPKDPAAVLKMVGQFTDSDGKVCAVLSEGDTKPTQIIRVGSTVALQGNPPDSTTWEVVSIGKYEVGLKDIKQALGVTWSVRMKSDSASIGAANKGLIYNPYQTSSYEAATDNSSYVDAANAVNLTDALQNQNANGVLGQTPEDIERSKQIQQQNFKMMNELMQKQREAILRQQEQFQQQRQNQQPLPKNQPQRGVK